MITSLASDMSGEHDVYLVTTAREDGQEGYHLSDAVQYINIYTGKKNAPALFFFFNKCINYLKYACSAAARKTGKNIKKHILHISPDSDKSRHLLDQYTFHIRKLEKLKKKCMIDCTISFLNSANYINAMADAGDRRIISIRSCLSGAYAPRDCQDQEGRKRVLTACRLADAVIPVSREAGTNLIEEYDVIPSKVCTIYNYVDQEHIIKCSEESPQGPSQDQKPTGVPNAEELNRIIDRSGFVFFTSGRLTEKKGQWHMIRAFKKVVQTHPEATLIIMGKTGKGNEDTTALLQQAILKNGLEEHVILAGFYKNPYSLLRRGDAFVMTSFNEGFPNALVEAMALSLPTVAADCSSGPREILSPDTDYNIKTAEPEYAPYGILVPLCSGIKKTDEPLEDNERLLADVMIRLIEDTDLRAHYGRQSLQRVLDFSKEKTLEQWKAVINEKDQH